MPEGYYYGATLTFLPVFFPHNARVMARRDIQAQCISIMNLYAIDTDIDPTALFRLAGDDAVGGTDIPPAVQLMPLRSRKDRHVDVGAGLYILQDRSG